MELTWLFHGNSGFGLQPVSNGLGEFRRIAEVHLRRVYEQLPEKWYALVEKTKYDDSSMMELVGTFNTAAEACMAAEKAIEGGKGT